VPKFPKIKPVPVEVEVEHWGGEKVHILPLTGAQVDEIEKLDAEAGDEDSNLTHSAIARATVAQHLVDDDGGPHFDYDDKESREELLSLPHDGLLEVYSYIRNPFLRKRAKVESAKGN